MPSFSLCLPVQQAEEILTATNLSQNKQRLILSYTKYFYFGPK